MFGKETETSAPVDPRATSILAQGCKFKGEVDIQGTFRVEGEFEGAIRNPENLVVGKTGVVRADIIAKNATIGGKVVGNVTAENKIELQSGSHLEGDIRTRRLVIDEGVFFEGNCSMGSKERALEQRVSTAAPGYQPPLPQPLPQPQAKKGIA
jgi:cytoskeletal protein CcmA (bactofilin family)